MVVDPCMTIASTCEGAVGESGAITFRGTVKNCGDVPINGVNVSNLVNGISVHVFGPFTLNPGQETPFTGSYVPAQPCNPSTAILTATGSDTLADPKNISASTSITCSSVLTPGVALTTFCPAVSAAPGEPIGYRGTVRNTGNVTLTDIVVVGDKPAANSVVFQAARLAPGEAVDFTGSYTAPVACDSTIAFRVTSKSTCSQPANANSSITCPIRTTPQVAISSACPVSPTAPGAVLSYTGSINNPGNVPLRNVRVFSERNPAAAIFSAESLAPGASLNFSGNYTAPLNVCSTSETLTVIGQDVCSGVSITNLVRTVCPLLVAPRIEVTQQCPTIAPAPGAPLNYSGTVRNSGNITLNNVVVTSDHPVANTVVFTVAALAPGAVANFTGAYPAPGDACSVANTLSATGQNACGGASVAATVSSVCPVATAPKLVVTRICPVAVPLAGTALTYSGTVQNTGNVTLTNVVVLNDHPSAGTVVLNIPSLAPGASANFTGSYATAADTCTATDTVTATGRDACSGQTATDSKTGTCPLRASGSIRLTLSCPTTPANSGGSVTISGTVTNPGNVTLNNITVANDAVPGTAVFTIATLAPKASAEFTTALAAQANSCAVTASFTATASERCGTSGIRDTAAVNCPVVNAPAIAVTHDCPALAPAPGDAATFTGSVRNGPTVVFGPASLEPGASASFTGTYAVPADVCTVTTTLTASGSALCDNRSVTSVSTKDCTVKTAPRIVLTKTCPADPVAAGGQITYAGAVKNDGNVTLTDVVVNSGNDRVFGPVTLAPGATATFTGSARVPADSCTVTDTWTASGKDKCSSTLASNSATTTCPVKTEPKVQITLKCSSESLAPGGTAKYEGTVLNLGAISLTGVSVVNDASPATPVFTAATLAPGASATFTFTVNIPADACSVTSSASVSAAGQCDGKVAQSASATCSVTTTPKLEVSHSCPAEATLLGFPTAYSGRVSNTGNVTLTNVVVLHANSGSTPVFGPATLAPGQSASFNGTYTVPDKTEGCSFESRVTATGSDRCSGRGITAENRSTCPIQTLPGLEITFKCPERQYSQGDSFVYRAVIKNIGNVRLENVFVYDSLNGNRVVWSRDSLSVGESHEMNNYPVVPENCCTITTSLRATAIDSCSKQTVTDTTTGSCPILYSPKIAVTKTCPERAVEPGATLTFTGTLSNPGDVTLTEVNLMNDVNGKLTKILGPIALAPKQVVNYKRTLPPCFRQKMPF